MKAVLKRCIRKVKESTQTKIEVRVNRMSGTNECSDQKRDTISRSGKAKNDLDM